MGYKRVLATLGIVLFMGTSNAYADKVPVEFMEWSDFKKIIPITRDITKENSVVIEDVETGATFRVISTAGEYHADIESFTKEDAAIRASLFKKGSWKRSVLVHVKGKVIAASMYGEPHCGLDNVPVGEKGHDLSGDRYGKDDANLDAVKGNNEDGVMCIHVRGCINHFNKKTDSASQANIDKIEGKYPDGVEYKGDITTSSSNSNNKVVEDNNPEASVGDLLDTKDDFITGKLIGGYKKLKDNTPAKKIDILEGSPPSGSYYFSYDGVLVGPAKGGGTNTSGLSVSGSLFNKIRQGKERAVVKELQDLQKKGFPSMEISGDLNGTQDFWTYDLNKLYSNSFASNFKISDGKTEYTIYVPKGKDANGNQINGRIIGATIRSIKLYKEAVIQGMYGGFVVTSYNLFSMYPTVQLPMTDVVDITKIDKNNVRPLKSTTRMKYTLDYYYHPVLGKMSAESLPSNDAGWLAEFKKISYASNGGKLSFTLDDAYKDFMSNNDPLRQGAVQMKDAILRKSNGMQGYSLLNTNDKAEPASLVGTLFRVAVPKQFERSLGNTKYVIKEDTGYNVLDSVRLSITHARVFVGEEDSLKVGGDYANFGIDEKGLAFYKTIVDGKTVGAIIPLWYNEAVYDPYEDKLYYTGRPIRFDNDYVGKIEFKKANVELLSAVEKAGGNRRVTIQEFAFGQDKDYLKYDDHENIGNEPDVFDINITFEGHKVGKPNEHHSINGGAEADIEKDKANEETNEEGNTSETVASIGTSVRGIESQITPNYGIPTLASVVYADDSDSVDYSDYYDDIVVTEDYDSYSIPDEGSVSWLARVNPLSKANNGANADDANKDWGHGVTANDLKKLSKNKYKGKEELIIKVANVYKVNPALMLSIMMVENNGDSALLNRANNCGSNSWFRGCGYPKDDVNSKWIKFPTLDDGINYLGAYLSRVYMSKGLNTLDAMGKKYCPPTYKDWSKKVDANFKKVTGRSWSKNDAGSGISGIMQIDVKDIDSNSVSTGISNTNNNNSNNDVAVVNTDEVFNGFTIVRNNVYLQEPGLLSWLGSKEARAMVNVEADELTAKILGDADMSNQMLTYKDWERMQSIRGELGRENSISSNLLRWTRIITMLFGFSLIFYSILLLFAYYVDIFNALLDVSLLSIMTFGRYYPITSKEDIKYLGSPSEGQKYVTVVQLGGIIFMGILVGSIFVLATPILELIATMYIKIKGIIGGI